MPKFKIDNIYGYKQLIPTMRVEGDFIVLGGVCKEYNGDGGLISEEFSEHIRVSPASLIEKHYGPKS